MPDARGHDVPNALAAWMEPFRAAFTAPTWQYVMVLVMGAILVPGRRTVASALRVMGLEQVAHFTNYHRVLNRNKWFGRWLSRRLFRLLVDSFVRDDEPVVIGLDDTIERRWGAQIKAPRHLSRSGAVLAWPLRQGERPALALAHAAARDSLGGTMLGTPVLDCPGSLGEVLAKTHVRRAPAQEAHRLG